MLETEKIKVLVTALGTASGYAVVSELKKFSNQFKILGADMRPANEIATSKDVDEFYRFPSAIANQQEYYSFVREFCKNNKVQYLYCFIDEEVVNLARHRSELEKIGTKLCLPEWNTIELCHYKNKFSDWINLEFPEIAIYRYKSTDDITKGNYPVFIKPIEGRASIGCRAIQNEEELNELLKKDYFTNQFLIQEFVEGDIITVDMIRNRKTNQIAVAQRKELLRNANGCGIAVEIINIPMLTQICRKIAERLDLNGVVNIEFFQKKNGFAIIEINPRFSAGTAYSCKAGCNTVINALRIAMGIPCEISDVAVGKHFAKRYEIYEM